MNEIQLAFRCSPVREHYTTGEAVPVKAELENKGGQELEILAAGVPWTFHHAVKFTVSSSGGENAFFENRLWAIEPPSVPDIAIAPGQAVSGEVDLARYLYTKDNRNISEVPGTYNIRARLVTFVSVKGQDKPAEQMELDSGPFTIAIGNGKKEG